MTVGESSKRRQQRGASWGEPLGATANLVSNTTAMSLPVPTEATHVRLYSDSDTVFVRLGWNTDPTAALGVMLGLRQSEILAIPPDALTLRAILTTAGTSNLNLWFYSVGSQAVSRQ